MGFRQGGYATVWEVTATENRYTKARISTSRKNKQTEQYETDFNGFATFIGEAHQKAGGLQPKARIRILSCDVTNTYNKEEKREYVNYAIFDFELADGSGGTNNNSQQTKAPARPVAKPAIEVDDDEDDMDLPF